MSPSPPFVERAEASSRSSATRTCGLTDPGRLVGAKPAAFCAWLFQLLGLQPGDELVDLFPGSGGVGRSWEAFRAAARDASSRRAHQVDGRLADVS